MSDNKFLAKIASDLDKPRGFAVLGRNDAPALLATKPVSLLWGVVAAMQRRLARDGITLNGQLAELGDRELTARYGRIGARIARLARGEDHRAVLAHAPAHTISAETTLARDQSDPEMLSHVLWPLCERLLKLKTADFRVRSRSRRLTDPSQLADTLFRIGATLLAAEADGVTRFRLIGVGADALADSRAAEPPTLFDQDLDRPRRLEQAMDQIAAGSATAR